MSPAPIAIALGFALLLWWVSTGAILWLSRLTRGAMRTSLIAMTGVAALAGVGLWLSRDAATPLGAFTAFTAAIAIWDWHELSFLAGVVTGPSAAPCPPGARGWARFRAAAATLIHHEVALALTAVVIAVATLGAPNPIGGWTFLVLFAARLSSKLNLFFGAPNFSAEFFPERLRHLASYLRQGPVSALYPVSLVGLGVAAAAAAAAALDAQAPPFAATGYALVFALVALAALEHAFMALPVTDTALWRWALPAADRTQPSERS